LNIKKAKQFIVYALEAQYSNFTCMEGYERRKTSDQLDAIQTCIFMVSFYKYSLNNYSVYLVVGILENELLFYIIPSSLYFLNVFYLIQLIK